MLAANYSQPLFNLKVMFSLKLLSASLAGGLFLVSCTPYPPYEPVASDQMPGAPGQPTPTAPDSSPERTMTAAQKREEERRQERIKANREAEARRKALQKEKEANDRVEPITPPKRDPIEPSKRYRTAMAIPGKPGYVFNPWTNKSVDVRGIPSGTLIRDPNDGDPDHKFRVP